MRFGWAALAAVVAAASLTATAAAKLTPAEQRWVTPLIQVWNAQNAGLQLVIQAASARNALRIGEKPDNEKLAVVLGTLLSCKKPKDRIKLAGAPPTARLNAFVTALNAACIADQKGAEAFTKAMVAYTAGKATLLKQLLAQGVADFRQGTAELTSAYRAIGALGGKKLFTA